MFKNFDGIDKKSPLFQSLLDMIIFGSNKCDTKYFSCYRDSVDGLKIVSGYFKRIDILEDLIREDLIMVTMPSGILFFTKDEFEEYDLRSGSTDLTFIIHTR